MKKVVRLNLLQLNRRSAIVTVGLALFLVLVVFNILSRKEMGITNIPDVIWSVWGAESPIGTATGVVRSIISGKRVNMTAAEYREVWGIKGDGKPFRISKVSDYFKASKKYDSFYAKWFVSHNRLLGITSSSYDPNESEYLIIDLSGEVIEYGSFFPKSIRNGTDIRQLENQFKWFALRMNGRRAGIDLQDIISNSATEEPFSVIKNPAIDALQAGGYEIRDISAYSDNLIVVMSNVPHRMSSFTVITSRYEAIVCILNLSTNALTKVSFPGSVNIVPDSFDELLADESDSPFALNIQIMSFEVIRPPNANRSPLWAVSFSFRDSKTNNVRDSRCYIFEWNPELEPEVVGNDYQPGQFVQSDLYTFDSSIYDPIWDNVYATFRLKNGSNAKLAFLDTTNQWHQIEDFMVNWNCHSDKALDAQGRLYFIITDNKSATWENAVKRFDPSSGQIETIFQIGPSRVFESNLSNPPQ